MYGTRPLAELVVVWWCGQANTRVRNQGTVLAFKGRIDRVRSGGWILRLKHCDGEEIIKKIEEDKTHIPLQPPTKHRVVDLALISYDLPSFPPQVKYPKNILMIVLPRRPSRVARLIECKIIIEV